MMILMGRFRLHICWGSWGSYRRRKAKRDKSVLSLAICWQQQLSGSVWKLTNSPLYEMQRIWLFFLSTLMYWLLLANLFERHKVWQKFQNSHWKLCIFFILFFFSDTVPKKQPGSATLPPHAHFRTHIHHCPPSTPLCRLTIKQRNEKAKNSQTQKWRRKVENEKHFLL